MIEHILAFFEWLKAILAKETLFVFISVALAAFLAWLTHKVFYTRLEALHIDEVRYWIYLVVSYLLIIYGIRLVETVLKKVIIKKEKEE